MNSRIIKILLVFIFGTALMVGSAFAEGDSGGSKNRLNKPNGAPIRAFMNINNISTVIKNTGISDIDVGESNSGLIFPKGSGKAAIFISGLIWGARIEGDPQVRVGGSTYAEGLQGGAILSDGTVEDADAPNVRIYRVRPTVYPGGPSVDVSVEANDEGISESAVRAQYELDWTEWPAEFGAPYTDVDSNGTYDPEVDIPGVPGADQTIWYVANDTEPGLTQDLYGTNPLGIEMQATFWAYAQTGALGNMFFRRYVITNKTDVWNGGGEGPQTFRDMYVSMWSDPDVGNSTDDFAGSDTVLSLSYAYNALANDPTYNPLPPPAAGFDFFQGPLLDGVAGEDRNKNGIDDADDYAIFQGEVVGPGKINLPMTAAYYFARGDASVVDPTLQSSAGADQFYNFMQGRIGLTGEFFVDPNTQMPTTFTLTGDPQTGNGWVDGQLIGPGDRRIGMAAGPFDMAPGEVQEVVVAEICAGAIPGVDRLSAIGLLKFYDQIAQVAYDNFFDLPIPPPAPSVDVVELDGKIVLNWGGDPEKVMATESFDEKGYAFEGYNVYQLPTASSSVSEGERVATFDILNGVGKIDDFVFDPTLGSVVKLPVQFGNDTGIERFIEITTDRVKGGTPLINNIRYYFAVTAYNYNPDPTAIPNNLENPIKIITVIPQTLGPGETYEYTSGDTVDVAHNGTSDGSVSPIVVNPSLLTGHDYRVEFDTLNGEMVWNLLDLTANQVKLSNQTSFSGNPADYLQVDGMLVVVSGPPNGMKDWDIPEGTRRFTWSNAAFEFEGYNGQHDAFSGAIGWGSPYGVFGGGTEPVAPSELVDVLIKLASVPQDPPINFEAVIDPNDENVSWGYRYGRGFSSPMARPEFDPYYVNTSATGYEYQDFRKAVPLSAWDVSDPDNPQRLAVGWLENNQEGDPALPVEEAGGGLVDGRYWPGESGVFDNVGGGGPREWLWILKAPYSETPDPQFEVEPIANPVPVMWWLTVNRRGNVPFSPGGTGEDQFLIISNKVITLDETFTFTAPAPGNSNDLARSQIGDINVFPNPYYGVNSEEINKYNRFVTFTHLPNRAKIRIFNLAGVLVRTIEKDDEGQFQRWDLANDSGLPVASGLYLAYIELSDLGETTILKVAIIQEQQILDRF